MKTSIKIYLVCVPLALTGCATTASQSGSANSTAANTIHAQPTTDKVTKRDIVGYSLVNGSLYLPPDAQAIVLPPYQAPVEKVMVAVGGHVRKGTPLIQLSIPSAESAYAQAGMTLKQSQVAYSEAQAKFRAAVKAAQRQLSEAKAQQQAATSSGDQSAIDTANLAVQNAQTSLTQAQSDMQANVAPYRQQVQGASSTFRVARAGAKQSEVRSPITGTVVALDATPGQNVGDDANKPIAKIVNLDRMRVKAVLTPEQGTLVKPRMAATLTFTAIKNRNYNGEVEAVDTVPTSTRTGATTQWVAMISFTDPDGLVKPDMGVASCGIKTGEAKDVLSVPVGAVQQDPTGKPYVNVLSGQNWIKTVITTGLSDGQYVEIKSGLEPDQTVQVMTKTP